MSRCRKRRYPTELDAMLALNRCWRGNHNYRNETYQYWCGTCECWHLTSQREETSGQG